MSSLQVLNGASNSVPSEQVYGVMSEACLFKVFFYGWGGSSSYLVTLPSHLPPFKYGSAYVLVHALSLSLSLSLTHTHTLVGI